MYQIKNTRHSFWSGNFFKIFAIFFFIFIFLFVASSGIRSLVPLIFSPFLKAGDYFYKSFGNVPKFFTEKNKLIEENDQLLSIIENDDLNKIDYESVKLENQRLRTELGLKPAGDFVAVSVIARPPQVPLDTLVLDKGTMDAIDNENFVLAGERILIGKIVKVSKNKSTLALNSFAGVVSSGFVVRTNEPIDIKGTGGGNMEVKVPIDFDIVVGDKIMMNGATSYLLAMVGAIEEDRSSGFKNVLLSMPVNISKISIVFVESRINE
jgi:cell shape-determining protein MreC